MIRVLISACLAGERVRYHGGHAAAPDALLSRWREEGRLVPFCPEVAGGFGVPREPAEISTGDGNHVLDKTSRVVDRRGNDVTAGFVAGATLAVEAARLADVRLAILKDGSPSCASTLIYAGRFDGATRSGLGVTAAALRRIGIEVFSERQLGAAQQYLETLEDLGALGLKV